MIVRLLAISTAALLFLGPVTGCDTGSRPEKDGSVNRDTGRDIDYGEGSWEECCKDGEITTCFCPGGVDCGYGQFTHCGGNTCAVEPAVCRADAGDAGDTTDGGDVREVTDAGDAVDTASPTDTATPDTADAATDTAEATDTAPTPDTDTGPTADTATDTAPMKDTTIDTADGTTDT